jgi:DNA-binding NarL/FixJ family response regulator
VKSKTVGLVNGWPVYVAGLSAALRDSGFVLEQVTDPASWAYQQQDPLMLVAVHDEVAFDLVVDLTSDPATTVVTLVDELNLVSVQTSLQAGAFGAVSLRGEPGDVVLALRAALSGSVLIPDSVARTMAGRGRPGAPEISVEQIGWLRGMASGLTVAELGRESGHSERDMFRRLSRLYRRLGARDRTQALLIAERLGLLV